MKNENDDELDPRFKNYLDVRLAEFDQKLEEQKNEQKLEFDQKLEEQKKLLEEQKNELETKIIELAGVVNKMSDARLLYWNEGESTSCGKSIAQEELEEIKTKRANYRKSMSRCFACNTKNKLSVAHIIASKSDDNFESFSNTNGYSENIETECEANYLVLCGTKGEKQTCHDAYDHFKISLYQDRVELDGEIIYKWFVCNPKGIDQAFVSNLNSVELKSSIIGKKYTRLLSWRTLRSILNPGSLKNSREIQEFMNKLQTDDENSNTNTITPEERNGLGF
jgi:hypothetical protein